MMSNKIKIGIVGGAGYTGGELLRILVNHPNAEIDFVLSKSHAGQPVSHVHADLVGDTDLNFSEAIRQDIDVLFLCVGHGEAKKFIQENQIDNRIKVIDLSQDYRLKDHGGAPQINGREVVYGLPEMNRNAIKKAHHVANPGCFATCIQLGLLPLAQAGQLGQVHTTGITGSTGAGQSLTSPSHFSWRANNIQAYKTLNHQHVSEIMQSIRQVNPADTSNDQVIHFIPWRGDFTRGIFVSSTLSCEWPLAKLEKLFEDFYADHPFTHLAKEPVFLKQVVNTNKCIVQLEKVGTQLVVHSAIDNLLKGASGQAVQNMNLMMGLDECAGLRLKAGYF
jgi:N-acetyl-gamma-glutamyl-phosphate reductase